MFDDTHILTGEPGPDLAAATAELDLTGLNGFELVDYIQAAHRLSAWAQALELAAMAEFAHRRPGSADAPWRPDSRSAEVSDFAANEIGAALRLSRWSADRAMSLALVLADRLPSTAEALRAGRIDVPKARVIADAMQSLDPVAARQVEARALARAGDRTVGQLAASLRRLTLSVDPAAARRRHDRARADRRVTLAPLDDGMAELEALLLSAAAATVYSALDALAAGAPPGDERSLDARRADALVDLADLALDDPAASPPRHRPRISVHVSASTLLGLDDQPGELDGYGPIPAQMARDMAAEGDWQRILTDPFTGTPLDIGTTLYRPPASMARHVVTRDRRCRFPGCRVPARKCQLDHTIAFPKGPTAVDNLGALCRHHHRLKTETAWRLRQDNGVFHWTSPHSGQYMWHRRRASTRPRRQHEPAHRKMGRSRSSPGE